MRAAGQIFAEDRNERRGHRAFGEQLPQKAWDPIRDEEGVGGRAGAEQSGKHDVPDEAENPAGEGRDPDDAGGLDELLALFAVHSISDWTGWLHASARARRRQARGTSFRRVRPADDPCRLFAWAVAAHW